MNISRRTALIGGSIATLALAGAVIAGPAFAKDDHGSRHDSMSQGRHDMRGHGKDDDHGMHEDRGPRKGLGRMLHSEGVVEQRDAAGAITFVTVRHQVGTVTAASDSSISLKSADGYTATWPITSETRVMRNRTVAKGSAFVVGDLVEARGSVAVGGVVKTRDIQYRTPRATPTPSASTNS